MILASIIVLTSTFSCINALPVAQAPSDQPYVGVHDLRDTSAPGNPTLVDLGYEIYRGINNPETNINIWKGIRFAAPPTSRLRWQRPQVPAVNRAQVLDASKFSPQCPQTPNSNGTRFEGHVVGNEDCLFLNVFAPANSAKPLPVQVWIHGGGYNQLDGRQDLTAIINANDHSFVGVAIEYRLGAFGFLSSQEVFDKGVVNAGLFDQYLALQWVQQYIHLFGGDPNQVTITGESAGAGSVMLLDMAFGGTLGDKLFQRSIAASPFAPIQNAFNNEVSTSNYDAFVERVGCSTFLGSKFDCLVAVSTETLQKANGFVTSGSAFGTWAFLPVTDGTLVQDIPSRQLDRKKVNGNRILTGNNALEAAGFVPNNIATEADVLRWLTATFPLLTDTDIQALLKQYPIEDTSITLGSPRFATNGLNNPNANELSSLAAGQQQRALNMYAEATFVCSSYWLAEAYTSNSAEHTNTAGYKYQYSVVPGTHGQDVAAYFEPPSNIHGPDFASAFKKIWGNFITTGDPSVSNLIANGQSNGNGSPNPISAWPAFDNQGWPMIDLNQTGRAPLENRITLVDANTWEGGRGSRCRFWKGLRSKASF